jgi:prophage regulatory protein
MVDMRGQRCRCVQHERKTFDQGRKQMRLEKSRGNGQAARHIAAGKRWGLWLKETANFQSLLKTPHQQQHPRQLVMTRELDRFFWERLLM